MTANLNASRFNVWLEQPQHEEADSHGHVHHVILVRNGDQLRAELEAAKLRLPHIKAAPLHATSLWLWAACARLGLTECQAQDFISTELVSYHPVKDGDESVDPTDPPPLSV
jgi:hypothetical protein